MATSTGRRILAGVTLAAVAGVGALGIAAISPLGVAGAHEATPGSSSGEATSNTRPGRGEVMDGVLRGLVVDGTIDQAQANEIAAAFTAKASELREQFGKGGGGLNGHRGEGVDAAAKALGMDAAALKAALKDDKTLAQVADAQGVDVQVVIDALVTEADTRIDAAVADGRLDAANADEAKAKVAEKIAERVNNPGEGRLRGRLRERVGG